MRSGPLTGVRVIELAGIGPAPYASMLLADAGADILRIERVTATSTENSNEPHSNVLARSRQSVGVNLKHPDGVALVLDLVERADAFIEGYRPGTVERLGIGPERCLDRNPRLIYGRMTGWGQDGPMSHMAGHDINYIAIAGALWSIGQPDYPHLPR